MKRQHDRIRRQGSGHKKNEGMLSYTEDVYDEEKIKMRSFARFPVSLYADYKVLEESGTRNISPL